ncbi:GntR family transcriptional regulator [Streptomyces sp. RLB3-6]|uniref:GntR family transcriptional regulator n=1 Tax=Streptomyces sp. RLB3-6 TaxID=2594457 RepID=UPI0011632E06|nr:GntR family transcriptional regulator [Streptomyces sp. RLB3-6]QDN84347.1 GntR family transcriptional regulator [Streptomyces sp. RLB3-6]
MTAQDRPRVGAQQIADDLRALIDTGQFQPGDRLPLTRELIAQYGVTGETIRQAIIKLKAAGLVTSRQGSGVYVRAWKPLVYRPQSEFRRKPPTVDIWANLLRTEGRDGTQTIEVSTMLPDEPIRRRLQLEEGELVAVRRRTSYVDGQAHSTDDSYVALKLVEGSEWLHQESVERGTNQVLAELGHELVQALDEIYTRMPRPAEAKRLDLNAGTPTPVVELISTGHDASGKPVQVTIILLPGDRHLLVYERNRYYGQAAEEVEEGDA